MRRRKVRVIHVADRRPLPARSRPKGCPRVEGLACPADPCAGRDDPGVCDHLKALDDWRRLGHAGQVERCGGKAPGKIDPAVRDAVMTCPHRGPVLPLSMQDDCGCAGKELSECRDGRGTVPGKVTLRECLSCKGG